MSNIALKYTQWLFGIICLIACLAFVLLMSNVAPGEKLSELQMYISTIAWGVFGFCLMGLVGVKAYREFLAGKSAKVITIVQVTISVIGMFGAIYLAWSFGA